MYMGQLFTQNIEKIEELSMNLAFIPVLHLDI